MLPICYQKAGFCLTEISWPKPYFSTFWVARPDFPASNAASCSLCAFSALSSPAKVAFSSRAPVALPCAFSSNT